MFVNDYTAEVATIFTALRGSTRRLAEEQVSKNDGIHSTWTLPALRAHPLYRAVAVTSSMQAKASITAQRRIDGTLTTLDSLASFSGARVKSQLLLCEAELTSVSAAITELLLSLEKTREERERQLQQQKREAGFRRVGNSRMMAAKDSTAEFPLRVPPLDFIDHLAEALGALRTRNTHWRQQVALCKEELALYRSETSAFARCGVSSCEPSDLPCPAGRGEENRLTHAHLSDDHCSGSASHLANTAADSGSSHNSAFGLASEVARNLMQVDSLVKGVLPASLTVLSGSASGGIENLLTSAAARAGATVRLGMEAATDVAMRPSSAGPSTAAATILPPLPPPPTFRYTAEEEERLCQQQIVLTGEQRAACAHDARLVEQSVRELSQLTSLMSERVVEQSENFSILMKNTTEAKNNYDKALAELRKAEGHRGSLNSTRQLILLLWLSTALLLATNWLVK